jgi:hypothetical protein
VAGKGGGGVVPKNGNDSLIGVCMSGSGEWAAGCSALLDVVEKTLEKEMQPQCRSLMPVGLLSTRLGTYSKPIIDVEVI